MFLLRSSCKEISSFPRALTFVLADGNCTVSLPPKNPAIPFFLRMTIREVFACDVTSEYWPASRLSICFCCRKISFIRNRCSFLLSSRERRESTCSGRTKSLHCSRKICSSESAFRQRVRYSSLSSSVHIMTDSPKVASTVIWRWAVLILLCVWKMVIDSCSISATRLRSCKTMATIQPMTAINNKYPATILCCNNNDIISNYLFDK